MMKLYMTNKLFLERTADFFIECLAKVGVKAEKVENGILFDSEAFKHIDWWKAPMILLQNRPFMQNL